MAEPAYKILLFMKKRPDITTEAFRDYYENHHAPFCAQFAQGIARYVRRYVEPLPHPETGPFTDAYDVITELWFDTEERFRASVAYLTTAIMPEAVIDDELKLFDRSSFRIATVVERETVFPPAA